MEKIKIESFNKIMKCISEFMEKIPIITLIFGYILGIYVNWEMFVLFVLVGTAIIQIWGQTEEEEKEEEREKEKKD